MQLLEIFFQISGLIMQLYQLNNTSPRISQGNFVGNFPCLRKFAKRPKRVITKRSDGFTMQ